MPVAFTSFYKSIRIVRFQDKRSREVFYAPIKVSSNIFEESSAIIAVKVIRFFAYVKSEDITGIFSPS